MLTTAIAATPSSEAARVAMLRWVFGRNAEAITCEIDFIDGEGDDVSVVPHWAVSSSAVEHFSSPLQALERHAELALALREQGWTMIGSVTECRGLQAAS